ncbi:MAG: mnmA, partial [Actinomycetia bacterium]|nr:mnmA [Actinomycetes bacterium]
VGSYDELLVGSVAVTGVTWVDGPVAGEVEVQSSAHGRVRPGTFAGGVVTFAAPAPRVAPGQSVVLYRGNDVLGGGLAV